jgi:hypothetical protein
MKGFQNLDSIILSTVNLGSRGVTSLERRALWARLGLVRLNAIFIFFQPDYPLLSMPLFILPHIRPSLAEAPANKLVLAYPRR